VPGDTPVSVHAVEAIVPEQAEPIDWSAPPLE
jgi:hypothetical protein